ncbi:MAG: hypothetical protein P0119_09690 [Nitrospira sp.]|nr:hypothetical protein [Nitrospira sp.]
MRTRILEEHCQSHAAHVRRNADGSFAIHHLEDHLRTVGDLVGEVSLPNSRLKRMVLTGDAYRVSHRP